MTFPVADFTYYFAIEPNKPVRRQDCAVRTVSIPECKFTAPIYVQIYYYLLKGPNLFVNLK